jgi:hypothetical protein
MDFVLTTVGIRVQAADLCALDKSDFRVCSAQRHQIFGIVVIRDGEKLDVGVPHHIA